MQMFSPCIVPSLGALLSELHSVCANWYSIGLQLDIPHTTLDCFAHDNSNPKDSMREMLKYWLKKTVDPPPTWEAVVTALRSRTVDEQSVAEQLESKYCAPLQPIVYESKPTSKTKKRAGIYAAISTDTRP